MENSYKVERVDIYNSCENGSTNQSFVSCYIHMNVTDDEIHMEIIGAKSYIVKKSTIMAFKFYGLRLIITSEYFGFNILFTSCENIQQHLMDKLNELMLHDNYHRNHHLSLSNNGSNNINRQKITDTSHFDARTDIECAAQYFNFYAQLFQQQNMLQDSVRTYTYYQAIIKNPTEFRDKIVLDVGTGSGILAFFAAQAGAKKVYAVEASDMSHYAKKLIEYNTPYSSKIEIIRGKIEEVEIPELVDTIISEPLGYLLVNERMIESFLHAKKFLKPSGRIFPSHAILYFSPFTDEFLYSHVTSRAMFWCNQHFYGLDLSILKDDAMKECFSQPIIDLIDTKTLQSLPGEYHFDFNCATENDLHKIEIPFTFECLNSGITHGLAFWFDAGFVGTDQHIWLSTAPNFPITHWYQVKCMFSKVVNFQINDILVGKIEMIANSKQSYFVSIKAHIESNPSVIAYGFIDLKSPYILAGSSIVKPNVCSVSSNNSGQ